MTLADIPIMLKYTRIAARNLEFRPTSVSTQEPRASRVSGKLVYGYSDLTFFNLLGL
jgi:hypothetical protein